MSSPDTGLIQRASSPAELETCLLRFINEVLPRFDRRGRTWAPVSPGTPLFATGLLDSLSILHLISAIETYTGQPVPDHLVVMKHFQSIETMTAAFWPLASKSE